MALEGNKSRLGPGGYPKAPYGSFAGRMPPVIIGLGTFTSMINMDYGPTFGTNPNFLFSNTGSIASGPVILGPGNSAANIAPTVPVTVILPDVVMWSIHPQTAPQNFIQVRDISGQAGTNNITIMGTGGQLINGTAMAVINTNWKMLRFAPDVEAPGALPTGWTVV